MAFISDIPTTVALLEKCARAQGERLFAADPDRQLSISALNTESAICARQLVHSGIRFGDRVAVMLDNHLDYVVLFFALLRIGAIQVPVNTRLRHDSLAYLLSHCAPDMTITESHYRKHLDQAGCLPACGKLVIRDTVAGFDWQDSEHEEGIDTAIQESSGNYSTDTVLFIMYTSGTTGPPKGVMVTDRMLRASALSAAMSADTRPGDRFLVWEPLYHIGAAQLIPMVLECEIELHFIGRFSASEFWQQARDVKATHIHFLGGILQILLRQPPSDQDRHHHCRIAWGGGAPVTVAREFESRFGIEVRENYGMTEASSLTSINTDGHKGSVGQPAPWFEVQIIDGEGKKAAIGVHGEIAVREREPGLITPGYYCNPEATTNTIRDGWLYTGDLGFIDQQGYLHYAGRLKESIRRRGENISAWEIERVVERLPFVEQAAAIGVPDELGDEEIKLFVKLVDLAKTDNQAEQIAQWCRNHLAEFQLPRYIAVIDAFPLTGTQRIRKELLSRSTDPDTESLFVVR